eukprot:scaffold124160_cov30-Tisochrysis_lutea.AAC.1
MLAILRRPIPAGRWRVARSTWRQLSTVASSNEEMPNENSDGDDALPARVCAAMEEERTFPKDGLVRLPVTEFDLRLVAGARLPQCGLCRRLAAGDAFTPRIGDALPLAAADASHLSPPARSAASPSSAAAPRALVWPRSPQWRPHEARCSSHSAGAEGMGGDDAEHRRLHQRAPPRAPPAAPTALAPDSPARPSRAARPPPSPSSLGATTVTLQFTTLALL